MSEWPSISERDLLARLAMDDGQFGEYLLDLAASLPPRQYDAAAFERAIGYPWERPRGSFQLTAIGVEPLEGMDAAERERVVARFVEDPAQRLPLLAIGSNGAPETLRGKFAHFPAENDREVLALTGRLHDFDVGAAAQPTLYGSLPATLFPSPGTEVCASLLWVTPAQFTQLTWSELNYRLGRLRTRFEADDSAARFDEVLVFVSRFGAFCPAGNPVALAAIPAAGRTAPALSQRQALGAAAALALGPGADAEALVRAVFEDMAGLLPKLAATVNRASLPFASERWAPFGGH